MTLSEYIAEQFDIIQGSLEEYYCSRCLDNCVSCPCDGEFGADRCICAEWFRSLERMTRATKQLYIERLG